MPSPKICLRRLHSRARLHLEPDDEQEQDDAQFGDVEDRLGFGDQPQAERPDGEPRREVAQHRAEPRPLEHRHREHARREQRQHLPEFNVRLPRVPPACSTA